MVEYNHVIVGKQIQTYRVAKGLSQKDLAKLTGISKSYINDLENGGKTKNSSVSMIKICKISEILEVNLDDLAALNLEKANGKSDNQIIDNITRELMHLNTEKLLILEKSIDIFKQLFK